VNKNQKSEKRLHIDLETLGEKAVKNISNEERLKQTTAAEIPGKNIHPETKAEQINVQGGKPYLTFQNIKSSSGSEIEHISARPGSYLGEYHSKGQAAYKDANTWDEREHVQGQKMDAIQSKDIYETVGRITDDAVNELDKNQPIVGEEENVIPPSVNEKPTQMISLFDFAGQDAYYACHHIFLSPRSFYILVTDMSKGLDEIPVTGQSQELNNARAKVGRIHSDWTYQGMEFLSTIVY
jgi:hypothetical protein